MIEVFYGDDRVAVEKAVKKFLGGEYELVDGENLTAGDLPSLFFGTTLFATEMRRILIKDVGENKEVFEKLVEYAETEHLVAIWEKKLDKRTVAWKALAKAGVKANEFKKIAEVDPKLALGIFETAMRDGTAAVKMCEQIEEAQDPFMFTGLLVSQAIKKFEWRAGAREQRILKELAKLDLNMKSGKIEPWMQVKAFLLRLKQL